MLIVVLVHGPQLVLLTAPHTLLLVSKLVVPLVPLDVPKLPIKHLLLIVLLELMLPMVKQIVLLKLHVVTMLPVLLVSPPELTP